MSTYSEKELQEAIQKAVKLTLNDIQSKGKGQSKVKFNSPSNISVKTTKSRNTRSPVVTFDSDFEDEDTTPDESEEYTRSSFTKSDKKVKTTDDDYFIEFADDYIKFTGQNPTTLHAIHYFSKLLEANGFKYLSEKEDWTDLSNGLYYTTRNGTSLGAFAIGGDWKPEYGVGIIGTHIDADRKSVV